MSPVVKLHRRATRLELGAPARCAEATVGEVSDVVIDPIARHLTHVVLATHDGQARLVPRALVVSGSDRRREVKLGCTVEEVRALEPIREFAYLHVDEFPEPDADSDIGVEDMLAMPSYEQTEVGDYVGVDPAVGLRFDRIPKGEVEIRRSSAVHSSDGQHVGHVDGLVVVGEDITHLVVERGHLWRSKDIAVPIESIESIETDAATVKLSKDELEGLPRLRTRRIRLPWR